ncbi:MAG: hypothetical protein IAI49_04040 [Candidatus Eremiobacteraeota bacterium]|nr:hypothetical protein [Candidatus Eremiobacteraeota bacterium]
MSRQIVNTGGQGLASSDSVKAAIGGLIVAIVVLLIFFGLNKSGAGDRSYQGGTGSAMGAPAPAAT